MFERIEHEPRHRGIIARFGQSEADLFGQRVRSAPACDEQAAVFALDNRGFIIVVLIGGEIAGNRRKQINRCYDPFEMAIFGTSAPRKVVSTSIAST
jgi:hypothetical protein